jgi:FtsH-binding integral membrane protein
MADAFGLFASIVVSLTVLNLAPGLEVQPLWQMFTVVILATLNLVVWVRVKATPISFHQAAKVVALCTLLLTFTATLDTLGGFIVGHQRTIPEAFIHSGPFGGIMDLFLFFCGLLFGFPTLVRALCLHYCGRSGP